jgi:hypothetical protein
LITWEVVTAILVLNIFHKGQESGAASDFLIAVATMMAKLTFTTLPDSTGRFKKRQESMIDAITFRDENEIQQVIDIYSSPNNNSKILIIF